MSINLIHTIRRGMFLYYLKTKQHFNNPILFMNPTLCSLLFCSTTLFIQEFIICSNQVVLQLISFLHRCWDVFRQGGVSCGENKWKSLGARSGLEGSRVIGDDERRSSLYLLGQTLQRVMLIFFPPPDTPRLNNHQKKWNQL